MIPHTALGPYPTSRYFAPNFHNQALVASCTCAGNRSDKCPPKRRARRRPGTLCRGCYISCERREPDLEPIRKTHQRTRMPTDHAPPSQAATRRLAVLCGSGCSHPTPAPRQQNSAALKYAHTNTLASNMRTFLRTQRCSRAKALLHPKPCGAPNISS